MPRGRKGKTNQGAGTRKPLLDPPPPAPTDAQVHSMHTTSYNVPTFTSQASLQSLRGHILSLLTGLVSDITEMKYSLMESLADPPPPPPTVDNLTFQDVDAIIEWLKEERGNYKHHLLILTHFVSDLSKMKHLITGPTLTPEPKILPFCLQEEIMKRLPVKSLLRFRSVSRSWKSLIDSSRFIGAHSHSNQPHHLLVEYRDKHHEVKYVSFADDDSFTHRSFLPAFPPSIGRPRLAGSSSYGLFCLECYDLSSGKVTAVIWNPSFRKLLAIDLPEVPYGRGLNDFFGFGVCPVTLDPKIVHITHLCSPSSELNYEESEHLKPKFWEVSVCNLSSGRKFRNLSKSSSNLPNVSMRVSRRSSYVVIDRLIYWYAVEDFHSSDGVLSQKSRNLIMSFDITEEKFEVVELPDCLASLRHEFLSVSKLRESLVVLESNENRDSCGVWKMMGHGSQFTKLFTIKNPSDWGTISVVGFRKTGGPFIEVPSSNFYSPTQLVVYEPNSKHCEDLILEYSQSHIVESYVKTLLLIGYSACTSY